MKRPHSDAIETYGSAIPAKRHGLGPGSAGQSGDDQGLDDIESSSSESVEELLEEGQYFEAGILDGIENAPDADASEIHTHQVSEEDVPDEYLDAEKPETR
jgi:hypothetical protein